MKGASPQAGLAPFSSSGAAGRRGAQTNRVGGLMRIVRRLLWLAVFVAVLVGGWMFAHANAVEVRFDYLFGQLEAVREWMLVLASFGLGAVAGVAFCLLEMARLGLLARRYRKLLGRLEAELHGLRSLPLRTGSPAGAGAEPEPPEGTSAGRPGRGS